MAPIKQTTEYKSKLNVIETEEAIQLLKTTFKSSIQKRLNLIKFSSPLFFEDGNGLQDMLFGTQASVKFTTSTQQNCQIINSLAKWKRFALTKYNFPVRKGILCDANAMRIGEELSNQHSFFVDQWGWELRISECERTIDFLKDIVQRIFECYKDVEEKLIPKYPVLSKKLPKEIFFITAQELEDQYPDLTPEEREHAITRKHLAVFLIGIGHRLKRSKGSHGVRCPDNDDWDLNGDILFYNPILDICVEMSSMGIRVSRDSIVKQLALKNVTESAYLEFHKSVVSDKLVNSIGGSMGKSRVSMFFLEKHHIGEVQISVWPKEIIEEMKQKGVTLL